MVVSANVLTRRTLCDVDRAILRSLLVTSYAQYEHDFETERWHRYVNELTIAIDHPETECFIVAEVAGKIVGTLQLFLTGAKAYEDPHLIMEHPIIRYLAVHPDARGLGVAKQLLDQTVAYAHRLQAQSISLHTTDIMTDAVRLYETYGFLRDEQNDYEKSFSTIQCYTLSI